MMTADRKRGLSFKGVPKSPEQFDELMVAIYGREKYDAYLAGKARRAAGVRSNLHTEQGDKTNDE